MPLSWVRAFWQFFLFVIFNWEIITIDISTHYIQCEKNTVIVHVYGLFILFRSLCINRKSVNHMKMLVNGFVRILGLLINLNLLKACFFVFVFFLRKEWRWLRILKHTFIGISHRKKLRKGILRKRIMKKVVAASTHKYSLSTYKIQHIHFTLSTSHAPHFNSQQML